MEDYEKFCEKHLARIQGESVQRETSSSAQKNISLIQFHGIPVLSPLLSLERKKECSRITKALDVEIWKQNSRKRALLNRVQEILENMQVRKVSSMSNLDQGESESGHSNSESEASNGFTVLSNINLPSSIACCGTTDLEKTLEIMPADTAIQVTSSGMDSVRSTEEHISPEQSESNLSENIACPKITSPDKTQNMTTSNAHVNQEHTEVPPACEEVPDPYVMSLQNLLKKSREYIEREQTRRSIRSNSKRSVNENHSDKENDAVKRNVSGKERARFTGRSCTPLTLDKPSLNKSNILLQGASAQINSMSTSASPSFSKVDIPTRAGTPPVLDSDSDEEFKNISTFDHDTSIVRSLTGSYAKLPSPEPSMSPKMHRRRPRPSSMGHIVINNPVNAYELSPLNKGRAIDLIIQDVTDQTNASEPVPKFTADITAVCSSKAHVVNKNSSETSNHMCQHSISQLESKGMMVSSIMEGKLDGRRPYKMDSTTCTVTPNLHESYAVSQSMVTQKLITMNGIKPDSLLEKTKSNSPVELNKSYDVENPSPLLMQSQNKHQQMDTPNVSSGNEHFVENGFEKVKRRLDLDIDSSQKENNPYVLTDGTEEQEKWRLQDRRCPIGSVYGNKNETSGSGTKEEEILKNKLLAFEEMRKRLEEQHAQQLSVLIAEQEREQERLQKTFNLQEIEEQERKLKGKKSATADTEIPKMTISSGMELEWRKISESGLLETVLTQVETIHNTNSNSTDKSFANTTMPSSFGSTNEAPFYLWGPSGSGMSKISASRLIRAKTRWSQAFNPEMQMKFSKITALAKGFLTRRLMQTEKLKYLRQTVKDTMEFIKNFQSEAPLKRGTVSVQDASLQERVMAQLRAALYDIHDIFFIMEVSERMNILRHDREVRKEKMLRQMAKIKTPRERVTLSTATQKSLDRKKYMKAAEMGIPNKKLIIKQNTPEARVLQPNQGQNTPIQRLLCRQGTPKTSMKGVEQNRKKSSESRVPNKATSGVYAGRIQRKKPNVVTI
ncbi:centriolar coiled-coil protein of 110 kDa isoform X1 [Gopherus evgoodei]|uniref:centriolar coiled-coil protein of 110 kDa isoform X1 n=1 Tax=Gopherus evgoodei TaxID=1825980 RepID=UPI0011CEDADF|nr:centriolar coiled-coil protein of 110 kDa isoform X1 [Gopherus evgoodei]XP_030433251.1 centriolar coiled-coil protein of 110 kDa isoform X1 [Gopherus evgoodei]XP_030433252.1 centriolar coiled-coil protein of 110 kDa isoform X1 [Gopherus evgoodei]XP_030433253.1 centriolar coiled-coil protein of 110 kDa isoform X1 [Gopherus evgoodei]XP_030433255.1 centriolar coiled-coil protein of 110 kDa isoform X1 [Gopherus evgoodei]XP_030433256.1 centriolar coiled-coil protein of 110 kDa isoform X1 [Gopher